MGQASEPGTDDGRLAHMDAGQPAPPGPLPPEGGGASGTNAAAVAAYCASVDTGKPLSERKLAAMFGKTSRRWARNRMAEAAALRLDMSVPR
jgi:hypothetical protein